MYMLVPRPSPSMSILKFLSILVAVYSVPRSLAQSSAGVNPPASAPASGSSVTSSANTTVSLGYYCTNQNLLNQLVRTTINGQPPAGLNVSIPSNVSDASSLSTIAQAAWQFIVTYQIPVVAKSVALITGNSTAVNTFFLSNTQLADYTTTGGVTPNHDTLYNQAFLDLSSGPQIVSVPTFDTPKRYWIVQFSDAYQNYFDSISITKNSSGSYLLVGRNAVPGATYANFTADRIIYAPTDLVWVLGRVLVLNDSDTKTAYGYSKSYNIRPYDPAVNVSQNASSKAARVTQIVGGSGYGSYGNPSQYLDGLSYNTPLQWFNLSSQFIAIEPPVNSSDISGTAPESQLLTSFVQNLSNSNTVSQFQIAAQIANTCVVSTNVGLITNTYWTYHPTAGYYTSGAGTTYLLRAQDLRFVPTPLPVSEVIYYQTNKDSTGQILDASNGQNYTISFPAQNSVPATVFWSLTIYNSTSLLLFQNPIARYSIGDRTAGLVYTNNNSTLEVFLSATQPANGTAQAANWLPAPTNAPFQFILRVYGPSQAASNGLYAPPPIVKVPSTPTASTG